MVIALSLMVLLTVLAVGLLTLSTVSLRASSQSEAMQVARANARMALSLAMGQLQKTAGSDQRITAPAQINDTNAPAWLSGVWSGTLPTANEPVPEKDSRFLGYLASGNESDNSPDPTKLPDVSTGAVLMGKGSLGKDADQATWVRATKVDSPASGNGFDGRYAWSIFDEGTKAKADVVRKENNFGNASHQASMGAPARFGMEGIENFDSFDWFAGTDQAKLYTIPTSDLIDKMPDLQKYQQDVTTLSRGLVTDAARGGLRKDLSLLFDGTSLPAEYNNKRVYDDETVLNDVPNPYWSQVQEYASMYKKLSGANPVMKASVPSGYTPVKRDPRAGVDKVTPQAPKGMLLMPVVAKVQMQFSMVAKEAHGNWAGGVDRNTATAQDNYMVYGIYSPIITLYNPYNVALSFDQMRIDFKDLPIGFRFYRNGQPQTTTLAHFNQLYVYHPGDTKTPKTFGINIRSSFTGGVSTPVVLQPGENKVFGESVDGNWSWANNSSSFFDYEDNKTSNLNLAPGYPSQGVGFWIDWLTPQHIRTAADDGQGIFPISLSDSIDVGFGPMASDVSGNRLSIELNLMKGSQKLKSGALELDYGDTNRLRTALSRDPDHTFPNGEARLQRPYLGSEMFETQTTKLRDFTRAKAFAQFSYYAKTTLESDSPSKPWVQGGQSTSLSGIELTKESMGIHPFEASLKRLGPSYKFPCDAQNRGMFFTAHDKNTGLTVAPQYEMPSLPLQSLAQLRHANLSAQGFLPGAAYTVGESFATAMIPSNKVAVNSSKTYRYLDHAWLANNALWDGYYFSTLSTHAGPALDSKSLKTVTEEFLTGAHSLLNPRMVPVSNSSTADLVSQLADPEEGYKKSASHLMIDGAFNVNSVSVNAWAALLGSMNKESVDYSQLVNGGTTPSKGTVSEASFPFSRMRRATGPAVEPVSFPLDRHARWNGMRTLSADEIRELARHVVEEIKERGPFLSLAEFVNRRPENDKDLAVKGLLQAAIDKTTTINERFKKDSKINAVSDMTPDGYPFPEALEGFSATGAPGFLTQGDILSAVGSVISVRSDTFRIRSYGEALDPDQKVIARAWCEAVVQRMPDFVDAADQPEADIATIQEVNKRFGRRYIVTGFRWLGQDEV